MSAVGPRTIHIPAGLTIDEATHPELLPTGQANLAAVNVRSDKRGGLSKRPGNASLDRTRLDGTERSAGRKILPYKDTVAVIDGETLDIFSRLANRWVSAGRLPEATYRHKAIPTPDPLITVRDSVLVFASGYTVISGTFVAQNGTSFPDFRHVITVVDGSGAVIRGPEVVDSVTSGLNIDARLAVYGAIVVAFTVQKKGGAHQIRAHYLDTTSTATINAGWQSLGTIASDLSSDGWAFCSVSGLSNRVAVAYANSSGGASQLTVKTLDTSGVLETQTVATSSIHPSGVSLSEGSSPLWVAWAETTIAGPTHTTNFRMCGLTGTSLATTVATTATVMTTVRDGIGQGDTWIAPTAANEATLYAVNETSVQADGTYMRAVNVSGGATTPLGTQKKICGAVPASQPFVRNGRIYMHMSSRTPEEIVLCDVTIGTTFTFRPVAVPVQRGLFLMFASHGRVSWAGEMFYVHAFTMRATGVSYRVAMVQYDFGDAENWQSAKVNGVTFIGGGTLTMVAGNRVTEAGFLARPVVLVDVSAAGSHTFSVGRSYVATFEEVDADGNWHLSGVSDPVNTGPIASKKVVVSASPLSITYRSSGVRISLWGTIDGGSTYYRIAAVPNDASTEVVSYEDTWDDVSIIEQPLLYGTGALPGTNGASQDHRAPPGLKHVVSYYGMLVGANGKDVYHSSQPIDGEGQWFSPVFSQQIDGDASGLAVQDGAIVAFTRTGAQMIAGEPPSDNGAVGGLGAPRRLSINQGCVNANSIVTTDRGTFYQSPRGIELLTRSQTSMFVGEQVQDTLAANPVVTAAVLDSASALVIFSLATSQVNGVASSSGVDVVFDLDLGGWISRDVKYGGVASQHACVAPFNGVQTYMWLLPNGTVRGSFAFDDYTDGGAWVTAQYEPAIVKLGLLQEQRVYEMEMLLERHSAAGLVIETSHDGASYGAGDKVWAEGATTTRILPFRPKPFGSSIKIRIRDTEPAVIGNGRGFTFLGFSADISPVQGATRGTPRVATSLRR
jgi:hypothetical protein